MVNALMNTTLPTIVGMGVVSRATEIMFDRSGRRIGGRGKRKSSYLIVGISPTRLGANKYADKYRKALRKRGISPASKVKVVKVQGGYAAVYFRG